MGMKRTLEVLNALVADGIVTEYAIGGAVAAYNYVEAAVTDDLDIFVSFDAAQHRHQSGLITLGPILNHLAARGYTEFRKEGLLIEGWPVQFLPVASDLDAEALARAVETELKLPGKGAVMTRVLRPEHLVATAEGRAPQGPQSHRAVYRGRGGRPRVPVRRPRTTRAHARVEGVLRGNWHRQPL